jgi:hypothetical protein
MEAAMSKDVEEAIRKFVGAILHGDIEHRVWLLEAAEAFIKGEPLPTPRGKGVSSND